MAGIIKVLLAMQNDSIPGQLNFEEPNPHIPWEKLPVKVLTDQTSWPNPESKIAGVSAFGMSGTNAHVVIESPNSKSATQADSVSKQIKSDSPRSDITPELVTLSAKSTEPLLSLAESFEEHFSESDASLGELAATANCGRSHHEFRAAVIADSKTDAVSRLRDLSRENKNEFVHFGNARRAPRIAWQFTGQGSQFTNMARGLYDSQLVFRDAIDQCDQWLTEHRDGSLLDVLFAESESNRTSESQKEQSEIHNTYWTQPAIFAIQMGLVKLLESWSMTPNVVLGHSVGQYAAACTAGMMSWQNGLQMIAERGRLIGGLPAGGKMMAVFAKPEEVEEQVKAFAALSVAAFNGTHVVVSGEEDQVVEYESQLTDAGIRCKLLTTSHAFHSSLMDPVLEPFGKFVDQFEFQTASLPLICNVTGKVLSPEAKLDGQYWSNHIRQPVRFSESIGSVAETGCDLILEIGPQSVLTRMAAADWTGKPESLICCLQKDTSDQKAILSAVGQLYAHGANPDFRELHGQRTGSPQLLPTYPFQRRRFWGPDKPRAFHAEYHTAHPLLGSKIQLAGVSNETRFESFIEPDSPSWLPDHEVMNQVVLPGAAFLEMAIEIAAEKGSAISNLAFEQPLRPTSRTALQTIVKETKDSEGKTDSDQKNSDQSDSNQNESQTRIETFSSPSNSNQWTRNFSANLIEGNSESKEQAKQTRLDFEKVSARTP